MSAEKKGELEKRILEVLDVFTDKTALIHLKGEPMVNAKRSQIETSLTNIIDDARKDLWDYWRRNLIHEGLEKWFGSRIKKVREKVQEKSS